MNVQSIKKASVSKNPKIPLNHDDIPIRSSRSNYANTSFEISLSPEVSEGQYPSNFNDIPYIEPIASNSKTNLNKYVHRSFAKPKQCLPMIFDEQPPPFYDPQAIFENSNSHSKVRKDIPFPEMNGTYEEHHCFSAPYMTEKMSNSDFDLYDSDYSLSKTHISSATFTINSGSTYTLR